MSKTYFNGWDDCKGEKHALQMLLHLNKCKFLFLEDKSDLQFMKANLQNECDGILEFKDGFLQVPMSLTEF